MQEELQKAKDLKGKALTKQEKFLVEHYWNDPEFVLQKYSHDRVGYHRINS